jgi:hypothetical protein
MTWKLGWVKRLFGSFERRLNDVNDGVVVWKTDVRPYLAWKRRIYHPRHLNRTYSHALDSLPARVMYGTTAKRDDGSEGHPAFALL